MVDHLLAVGLRNEEIMIAEGGGVDDEGYTWDMREIYAAAAYVPMAAERGVRLMDLNRDKSVRVSVDGQIFSEIGIARTVKCEGRYVINVPKLKTHNLAVMTLSMKNLQGVITSIQERHLCPIHPLDFSHVGSTAERTDLRSRLLSPLQGDVDDGLFGRRSPCWHSFRSLLVCI